MAASRKDWVANSGPDLGVGVDDLSALVTRAIEAESWRVLESLTTRPEVWDELLGEGAQQTRAAMLASFEQFAESTQCVLEHLEEYREVRMKSARGRADRASSLLGEFNSGAVSLTALQLAQASLARVDAAVRAPMTTFELLG